ncbi:MAG TPA: hypothetical protein VGM88_10835 [Kofleriaceae bacterium]
MRFALLLLAGCAAGAPDGPGALRFRVAAPVTEVADRAPIGKPKTDEPGLTSYYVREDFVEPARRALTIADHRRAANVNALGDVPDSAWFTNRAPTAAEIRRGPGRGGPDRSAPWHVVGVKRGGAAIGITIEDAKHDRYILKFDEKGAPETETGADVVVQRLSWAFGYNVPDNEVVTFERADLVVGTGMSEAQLERYLAFADAAGGTYRALASKLLPGVPVGGIEPSGTHPGDANDRVPHELRRDLRGQRLLWAWVDHIDLKSANSLATYDGGHLTWYALDFGESLGVAARTDHVPRLGWRKRYAPHDSLRALVTLGALVEPWEEHASWPSLRGLGDFSATDFDPAAWVPDNTWRPIEEADRFDEFWAAAILMRFTPAQIAAAVDAGRYSDPRTAAYLVQTLVARQRRIGAYAFARVAPLAGFAVDTGLCFDDLWLAYGYGAAADTRYRTTAYDATGHARATSAWSAAVGPRTCLATTVPSYTIVRVDVARRGQLLPPVFVHAALLDGAPHVIGVDRR